MRKRKLYIGIIVSILFIAYCLLFIDIVQAQSFGNPLNDLKSIANKTKNMSTGESDPLRSADLPVIIGVILNGLLAFLGVLGLVLIIYSGIRWTIAGGNQETVSAAKQTLKWAVIGTIVVIGAYALTYYILNQVLTSIEPGGRYQDSQMIESCFNNTQCPLGYECINSECVTAEPPVGLMGCCCYDDADNPSDEKTCINGMTREACNNIAIGYPSWKVGSCP